MPKLSWPHADQHFTLERPGPLITGYLNRHARANVALAFDLLGPRLVYIQQRRAIDAPQASPHSQLGMAADNLQDMRLYTRMHDIAGFLPPNEHEAAYRPLGFFAVQQFDKPSLQTVIRQARTHHEGPMLPQHPAILFEKHNSSKAGMGVIALHGDYPGTDCYSTTISY